MSDGRSFLPVDLGDKTPEERLAQLEQHLPIMIQKIQSYDQVLEDFEQLKQKNEHLMCCIDKVAVMCDSNLDLIRSFDGENNRKHSLSEDKFAFLMIATTTLKQQIEEVNQCHNNMRRDFEDEKLHSKVQESNILALTVPREDFEDHCEKVYAHIDHLHDAADKDAEKINDLSHSIEMQKALQSGHESHFISLRKELNELEDLVKYLGQMSDVTRQAVQDYTDSALDKNYAAFEKRLLALRDEIQKTPNNAESIKIELSDKLEAVTLDGKNAVLKATNSSQQILLLEKKIENIYLLLKKYELNQ